MKTVLLLIIGLNIIAVAAASELEEKNVVLYWGKSVNVSGYNITAVDFRPGTVEEITNKTKCEVEPDPVTRKVWGCDDYVFLEISKDGNPVKDEALTERNISIEGVEFYNETVYENNEISLRIIAEDVVTGYYIPTPYAQLKILINKSYEFDIAKNLTITKMVPKEAHVNPSSEFIPVSIVVKNTGTYDLSYILVKDSIPEGFISKSQELGWSISPKSGETWQEEYFIRPLKPIAGKEYTLPPATLYFTYNNRTYNLSTGNSSFILHPSEIIVTKSADKAKISGSGNITVNISVKNNGSRAALVKVRDSLLSDTQIIDGGLDFSTVVEPGESYNHSYILKLNNISGNISLPYANFDFKEYWSAYDPETKSQAATGSGISNPVEIKFETAAQVQTTSTAIQAGEVTSASITEEPSNSSAGNFSAEDRFPAIMKKIMSLWIGIRQLPYAVLALLAGGLLAVLMLRIWRPRTDEHKDSDKKTL